MSAFPCKKTWQSWIGCVLTLACIIGCGGVDAADKDPCTFGDDITCDDGNSCTVDKCTVIGDCTYTPVENVCKIGEICYADGTANPTNPCELCDMDSALTLWSMQCDDGNPCTADSCDSDGNCSFTADDTLSCDDGNTCTTDDHCANGLCEATPCGNECEADSDCPNADPCQVASCAQGYCTTQNAANDTVCDDSDSCTEASDCQDGVCVGSSPLSCTAGDACNPAGTCDPNTGLCSTPVSEAGTACDDNTACTTDDICDDNGGCQGTTYTCDDGKDCTTDSCDGQGGCTFNSSGCDCQTSDDCDDSNPCNGVETCDDATNACVSGTPMDCSNLDDPCNTGACDAQTGQCTAQPKPNGQECDDDTSCTMNDLCQDGVCQGESYTCSDAKDCTVDSCDGLGGCVFDSTGCDCSGCLAGFASCDAACQNAGNGGGTCTNPGSTDPDVCCTCTGPPPVLVDCAALHDALPTLQDGVYDIAMGDGGGLVGNPSYPVYCDMTTGGGGWTLVAVSSDDGENTWTWNKRKYLTTNTATFGSLDQLHNDFKSAAYHQVAFSDLLFIHSTPGDPDNPIWAQYDNVGDNVQDLGMFIKEFDNSINYSNKSGIVMTGGTLTATQQLCSTELYINPCGLDGENYCSSDDNAFGPAWSVDNTEGCPLDDPGIRGGIGPDSSSTWHEYHVNTSAVAPGVGFGTGLGINTGAIGSGENHIKIFVRRSL